MKKQNKIAALLAASILAFPAIAEGHDANKTGPYIGGSVGQVKIDTPSEIKAALSFDDSKLGLRLFGGYQFNEFIAAELGLTQAKGFEFTLPADGSKHDIDYLALDVGLRAGVSINDHIAPFARLGMARWDADVSESCCTDARGNPIDADRDGTDVMFGGGVQLSVNQHFSVRAEWTHVGGDADTDYLSLSALYRF